jgi:hypothetical protein
MAEGISIDTNKILNIYNKDYKNKSSNNPYKLDELRNKHTNLNNFEAFILMYFVNRKKCKFAGIQSDNISALLRRYTLNSYSQNDLLNITQKMNELNNVICDGSVSVSMGGFYKQKVVKVIRKY